MWMKYWMWFSAKTQFKYDCRPVDRQRDQKVKRITVSLILTAWISSQIDNKRSPLALHRETNQIPWNLHESLLVVCWCVCVPGHGCGRGMRDAHGLPIVWPITTISLISENDGSKYYHVFICFSFCLFVWMMLFFVCVKDFDDRIDYLSQRYHQLCRVCVCVCQWIYCIFVWVRLSLSLCYFFQLFLNLHTIFVLVIGNIDTC